MQENKINKKNILLILTIILVVILLTIGILLTIKTNKNNNQTNNISNINSEKILKQLNIDKYLGITLYSDAPIDSNLLDTNYYLFDYYLYINDKLDNITIQFGDDPNNTHVYCKYSDYAKQFKKLFGIDIDDTLLNPIYLSELVEISPNIMKTSLTNISACEDKYSSNCYVPLLLISDSNYTTKFNSLKNENNIIRGNVRLTTIIDGLEYYKDSIFEFEYRKEKNNYYAVSLKLKSSDNAYHQIINKN